jgi:threonine dehydratase
MDQQKFVPTRENLEEAMERIGSYIHRTPVLTSRALNEMSGCELYFKCENFQRVGAFKLRGAVNTVLSLTDEEAAGGVITHSSGNHAQALALAASIREIPAFIVMPKTAPGVKIRAVEGYGGEITFCEPTLRAREETCVRITEDTGAYFIHPYNDGRIVMGQGTCAAELFDQVPGLEAVAAPVGGGGLISGTALAASYFSPETEVYGGEPAKADDAYRSFEAKKLIPAENPKTVADGLLTSLGTLTFSIILGHVKGIRTCSEEGIVSAMRHIWERMKIVVEPSASVPLACILEDPDPWRGRRVGIILSGGNVDLDHLPWT